MTRSHSKKDVRQRCLTAYQKLRRLEEADADGNVTCISCGKVMRWSEAQGGHFISRACIPIELEHDNIWPQCNTCNCLLYGNHDKYRERLIAKIGEERVLRLENLERAYKGSDDAFEMLSIPDTLLLSQRRGLAFYAEKRKEINKRILEITHK